MRSKRLALLGCGAVNLALISGCWGGLQSVMNLLLSPGASGNVLVLPFTNLVGPALQLVRLFGV